MNEERISVLLSGAPNDDDVLQTAMRYAARQRCELHVTLAGGFPKGTFLRHLDAAMWELARAGLPAPRVGVERQRPAPEPDLKENVG
ncbi:MAG TPA: hypothetical protein VK009_13105 [Chloroflexota bacterium]|nr:hypothetical protein [Chloroflexota bacterium]